MFTFNANRTNICSRRQRSTTFAAALCQIFEVRGYEAYFSLQRPQTNVLCVVRLIGIPPHPGIVAGLSNTEDGPAQHLLVEGSQGPLGPGGARALATAILGTGPGMKGGPYRLLKVLRFWRVNIGNDGAAALVRTLALCEDMCPKI